MRKLIKGLQDFRSNYVSTHLQLLEELSHGQRPRVLFVTCSDSRIAPNLLTNTDLGDLFVIRNAGNIIPPYGAANGGEGAAVEYAIHALNIQQIVVCGHSHCGAMKGLLQLGDLEETMPLVYDWLKHAEATRRLVKENYSDRSKEELLEIAIAENVLTQIENLKTYPVVRSRLFQNRLKIYAWIYLIETGEVLAYDPETHAYLPPQTQLSTEIEDLPELAPGDFLRTSAPPVACELPNHIIPSPPIAVVSNQTSTPTAPIPAAVAYGHDLPHERSQGNGYDAESNLWLSPEQADRIYRGSH